MMGKDKNDEVWEVFVYFFALMQMGNPKDYKKNQGHPPQADCPFARPTHKDSHYIL